MLFTISVFRNTPSDPSFNAEWPVSVIPFDRIFTVAFSPLATTPIPLVNAVIAFAVSPISSTESFVFEALPFRYFLLYLLPRVQGCFQIPFSSVYQYSQIFTSRRWCWYFPAPVILISWFFAYIPMLFLQWKMIHYLSVRCLLYQLISRCICCWLCCYTTPYPLILIDFPALFITVFPKAVLLLWIYIPVPAAAFNVPLFVTIYFRLVMLIIWYSVYWISWQQWRARIHIYCSVKCYWFYSREYFPADFPFQAYRGVVLHFTLSPLSKYTP